MSQDERLMILQMVAEKKITVNEAVELLKAIGEDPQPIGQSGRPKPPPPPPAEGGGSAGPEEASASTSGPGASRPYSSPPPPGSAFFSGLGSFIEDVVERVASAFSEAGFGRYEFRSEHEGEFGEGEIPLRIATGNGRVNVTIWDQPGYRAEVLVTARGATEAEARVRAQEAYTLRAEPTGIDLEARRFEFGDVTVNLKLYVPADRTYRLEARSGNGRIEVDGLTIREGQITTGNGRVSCRGGRAETLRLQSGNGALEIEQEVAQLEAGTVNGRVSVRPLGNQSQSLKLSAGNGSIRVDTSGLPESAAFRVEAETAMGGVEINLPNLELEQDVRAMAHKHVLAMTPGFEQASTQVAIKARTGMGAVSVF